MDKFETGMLARSKAGHDTGRVYVITGAEEAYVFLSDGRLRPLDRPKKKKKKHVQIILERHDLEGADDSKIRQILKTWNQKEGKQEE
ncbi:KOW domain-containing RNA-binding protein [uncultured Merdimonas sp.]|uniref:KOW domain-containing RNA-binding protein n=1 Tax=uncultured Merdimonas sp. TaxID=2023269 RepID=UPI00320AF21A